jgi:hypothetical protein
MDTTTKDLIEKHKLLAQYKLYRVPVVFSEYGKQRLADMGIEEQRFYITATTLFPVVAIEGIDLRLFHVTVDCFDFSTCWCCGSKSPLNPTITPEITRGSMAGDNSHDDF